MYTLTLSRITAIMQLQQAFITEFFRATEATRKNRHGTNGIMQSRAYIVAFRFTISFVAEFVLCKKSGKLVSSQIETRADAITLLVFTIVIVQFTIIAESLWVTGKAVWQCTHWIKNFRTCSKTWLNVVMWYFWVNIKMLKNNFSKFEQNIYHEHHPRRKFRELILCGCKNKKKFQLWNGQ